MYYAYTILKNSQSDPFLVRGVEKHVLKKTFVLEPTYYTVTFACWRDPFMVGLQHTMKFHHILQNSFSRFSEPKLGERFSFLHLATLSILAGWFLSFSHEPCQQHIWLPRNHLICQKTPFTLLLLRFPSMFLIIPCRRNHQLLTPIS